jgi:hypothetical protein
VAGINLYATVAVLGMLGRWGGLELPGELQVLTNGWVIAVTVGLYTIEFFADKLPYVDSAWDVAHTFIRIPAGAVLAAQAFGDYDPAIRTIALLVGGGLALGSHGAKAATRAAINLSPEPFTNISASFAEDVFTVGYVFSMYFVPLVSLAILVFCLIAILLFLPKLLRVARRAGINVRGERIFTAVQRGDQAND